MGNRDTGAAWEYHNATKHSWESVRSGGHRLEWSNLPRPYKLYRDLEALPLPRETVPSRVAALAAIAGQGQPHRGEGVPDLGTLATVLQLSAGVTKWLRSAGGQMAFRAAACTGALYHIELYLVSGQLPGLDPGVYQFSAHDGALRRLRSGDYRGVLAEATGADPMVAEAPVILAYTSTYWRNAWKYQARTYRHCFWDSGTILANTLALASAHQLPARVVAGFVDEDVNRLLDVDGQSEVALALVPLGSNPAMGPGPAPAAERLGLETEPLSATEVDYPAIRSMHGASCLATADEAAAWRAPGGPMLPPAPTGEVVPLSPLELEATPGEPIEQVILRRGSSRRFDRASVPFEALSTMLATATRGIPADFLDPPGSALNDLYLIANAVDGLASGAYVFHRQTQTLELLRAGLFREEAGYLDLGQELAADAAVNIYFLADLGRVLERLGNRGYRAAQLEASITAGKLYLAAYALGMGATGLTFFDDNVTHFFSPHAQGKSVMFLIALGRRFRRDPG